MRRQNQPYGTIAAGGAVIALTAVYLALTQERLSLYPLLMPVGMVATLMFGYGLAAKIHAPLMTLEECVAKQKQQLYETILLVALGMIGGVSCFLPVISSPSMVIYEWLGLGTASVPLGHATQVIVVTAVLRLGLQHLSWKYGKKEPAAV